MITAWTAEQIAALAPDAASLTAARKLRAKWQSSGVHDTALWGLCGGSGSRPYQTIVDLSGPAYKCSCPSRKFPCKHALSLLQIWGEGGVPAAVEPADFAADWLNGRSARAAKKATAATESHDGTAKATGGRASATADQRRARVTAGLADLDTWLTDQVRTGLAQADRSPAAFESMAARMVDAQAPGVAAGLRRLPAAAARSEWPQLLLREYARLHLLARAHARLDALSPALAAGVRTHIGYPIPAETVRAEPAVRDHWQVLGTRITVEDNIHTRRVWLRGRTSGRWALLLDHHHGGPSFPPDTPMHGFEVDADLHFYPVAAPLRAVWGARHGLPGPFTVTPLPPSDGTGMRAGGIAAALNEHAEALAADPFLRSRPVLLTEVVPVRGETHWHLVESEGTAIPISLTEGQPWKLLGLSGGHPVTVMGEWTAGGLLPVAAAASGVMVNLAVAERYTLPFPSAAPDSDSAELVSAALVGTARRGKAPVTTAGPVASAAAELTGDPAAVLLETLALQDCFARGATIPDTAERTDTAADDHRPLLPPAATNRLTELLGDDSPFLAEWFAATARHDYRAPDSMASLLLERAKAVASHRELLLRLAGTRGRWLAEQHPGWQSLVRAADEDESVWSHGRPAERRSWLARLRRRDPAAARAALAGTWARESGPGKAELLGVLAGGLSLDDEPLLESALGDRRAEVRRLAADLLARLPESAFARRMIDRASAWVRMDREAAPPELTGAVPESLDDAARRDGIGDPNDSGYRAAGTTESSGWLRRVVAATPLSYWEPLLGPPEQAVRTATTEEIHCPMLLGWTEAALTQQDSAWAKELFAVRSAHGSSGADNEKLRELFALQPVDDQVRHLRGLDSSWLAEIESLLRAVAHPWPHDMADHVLRLLAERARMCADRPGAPSLMPGSYRTLFRTASTHFPVETAAAVADIAAHCADAGWAQAFAQLSHDLIQRETMLEELK